MIALCAKDVRNSTGGEGLRKLHERSGVLRLTCSNMHSLQICFVEGPYVSLVLRRLLAWGLSALKV
jgi:hypothetical protein